LIVSIITGVGAPVWVLYEVTQSRENIFSILSKSVEIICLKVEHVSGFGDSTRQVPIGWALVFEGLLFICVVSQLLGRAMMLTEWVHFGLIRSAADGGCGCAT
jgi:hypothetical protein